MKPLTLCRLAIRTCLALAACFALAPQSMFAEIPQPVARLVGRSLDGSGTYAGPIEVVIARWSTQEEFDSVSRPITTTGGPAAVLALLEHVRIHVGYVLTPGIQAAGARALDRRSWIIDFAREVDTHAGRRIVVASQQHLPIGEFPRGVARGTPSGVDVLEIRFDNDGHGVGKLAGAGKLAVNASMKTIEIKTFDSEPVRVTGVAIDASTRRPVRTVVGP